MSFHLRFISEFYAGVPEVPGFFVLDALSAGLFVQNKKTADCHCRDIIDPAAPERK